MKNITIDYYNQHAAAFVSGTGDIVFSDIQERFLAYLPYKAKILDFGCGSGRDTQYFLNKGYSVDATDGSEELCRFASEVTGTKVKQMLFSELDSKECYDGIWACSSILHLPKSELTEVLHKMIRATKMQGYIYTSFKYSEFEGYRGERYFTDFTEITFQEYLRNFPNLQLIEYWISGDVRPGRSNEKWLNLILRKMNIN